MAVEIHNICVGKGDCFLIRSSNLSVMVDCGNYNRNVKKVLSDNNIEKLDLVIATHIDNDHISGLCNLLKEMPVDSILFNGFHHIPLETSNNEPTSISDELYNHLKEYSNYLNKSRLLESNIDANKSLSLSEVIREKSISWNTLVDGERLSTDHTPSIEWDGIKLQLLSPTDKGLIATYNKYREFIYTKTGKLLEKDKLNDLTRSLYDVAFNDNIVYSDEHTINAVLPLSKGIVNKYANTSSKIDTTAANVASLAFILEVEDKKILMLGDANPTVVTASLNKLSGGDMLYFDAIKVAHHGSSKNTTTELLSIVDSPHYLFSGGSESDKPSEYTISKIVNRGLSKEIGTQRNLYFNRENRIVAKFKNAGFLQKELGFTINTNHKITLE